MELNYSTKSGRTINTLGQLLRLALEDAKTVKSNGTILDMTTWLIPQGQYNKCAACMAGAVSQSGVIHGPFIDDFAFPAAGVCMLDMLKQMVTSGKAPMSYDAMLELIRIVEAARRSQDTGAPVQLDTVIQ